jgi:hypothetical protein
MNERIKDLAIECASGLDWDNAVDDPTRFEFTSERLERFAELIVRECADIIDEGSFSRSHCSEFLLKHFGVKP